MNGETVRRDPSATRAALVTPIVERGYDHVFQDNVRDMRETDMEWLRTPRRAGIGRRSNGGTLRLCSWCSSDRSSAEPARLGFVVVTSAVERWREALDAWAIPDEILATAPESPWIHPPILFDVPDTIVATPSHDRAREVLTKDSSVLDVGCGGGIAAFALVPPAIRVIGVDQQAEMLDMFAANAAKRSVACDTVEGLWPSVAGIAPVADVVTAHHVVYNVADIAPFVQALDDHARRRVVLELPDWHPLASMNDAWRHFWGLERPSGPTPADLLDVLAQLGIDARREQWTGVMRAEPSVEQATRFMRIRLCLPASRDDEVRDFMMSHASPRVRELSTVWWEITSNDA